jgi:glycerate 2-kinase
MTVDNRKKQLEQLFDAAVSAVSGRQAVTEAIAEDSAFSPSLIIAVGKAAVGMALGALDEWPDCAALVITKYGHVSDEFDAFQNVKVIEAAHPVPDENSLFAGNLLIDSIEALSTDSQVLFLVSGGASALAEALPPDVSLSALKAMTDEMLATGKTINQINTRRKASSLIKGGKLIERFPGRQIRVYAISDVEGDSIAVIGSGLGDTNRLPLKAISRIIASNKIARQAVASKAQQLGLTVIENSETLYGDIFELADRLGPFIANAPSGVYLFGGEPIVTLPEHPGRGGRNQSLALALSAYIAGRDDISVLVAGTDGTDGPTSTAGGLIDGTTWRKNSASDALRRADAGTYLEQCNGLFSTGPTHTNVMDLLIVIVN